MAGRAHAPPPPSSNWGSPKTGAMIWYATGSPTSDEGHPDRPPEHPLVARHGRPEVEDDDAQAVQGVIQERRPEEHLQHAPDGAGVDGQQLVVGVGVATDEVDVDDVEDDEGPDRDAADAVEQPRRTSLRGRGTGAASVPVSSKAVRRAGRRRAALTSFPGPASRPANRNAIPGRPRVAGGSFVRPSGALTWCPCQRAILTVPDRRRPTRSREAPVKLQEYHAKTLLSAAGLPVPPWSVARTPEDARARRPSSSGLAPRAWSSRRRSWSAAAARPAASSWPARLTRRRPSPRQILGMDIKGITVRRVLVAPAADIVKRVLPGGRPRPRRAPDPAHGLGRRAAWRSRRSPATDPQAIVRILAHPHLGLLDHQARSMAFALGLRAHLKPAVAIAKGLVSVMRRQRRRPRRGQPAGHRPRGRPRRHRRPRPCSASTPR